MLEIHVDVRGLVPFAGDEAFEEQGNLVRRHLGDAQAVADHRVGRRAAALAEDPPFPGKAHHVVHGEEVVLVVQLLDQGQLVLDACALLLRHAIGPASPAARFDQSTQVTAGGFPWRHHLFRVLIAQLVQAEMAAGGDFHAGLQQLRRVQAPQTGQGAQVLLAVDQPPPPQACHTGVVAQGGKHIVQGLAAGHVHLHITAGDHGQLQRPGQSLQGQVAFHLAPGQAVGDPQPDPARAQPGQLPPVAPRRLVILLRLPDQQAALEVEDHIPQRHTVFPLGAAPARQADQPRQLPIGRPARHQGHQPDALHQVELAADDQRDTRGLCRDMGLYHPGQGALVGEGDGRIALFRRPLHQLAGMRGAAQEAVATEGVEFGVGHGSGLAVKQDVAPDPVDVSLLGLPGIAGIPHVPPDLVEQPGRVG